VAERRDADDLRWVLQILAVEADSQDHDIKLPCRLSPECADVDDNSLTLDRTSMTFHCDTCGTSGSVGELRRRLEGKRSAAPVAALQHEPAGDIREADFSPVPQKVVRAASPQEAKVILLGEKQRIPTKAEIRARESAARAERRRGLGERLIIFLLALVFLCAGLAAAALSGFANYFAFASSVADPLQARIWGWTGVIAAIVSFGGFTFFYWHWANGRPLEGIRAALFALVGAGTSILGTEMYITANNRTAAAEIQTVQSNRTLLETQIADWRQQLSGIPPETRSVAGLEQYIAEVERVGRTDHKPYRDALNELGLAKRRDELQARLDAARSELLAAGSTSGNSNLLLEARARANIPSWFFAIILEVFSSQGTSIGLVALLILGRGRRTAPSL
jgi:hypothetical protein